MKSQGSKIKRKKSIDPHVETSSKSSPEINSKPEKDRLSITAVYNRLDELIQILMFKHPHEPIPRILMKVIALKVPFTQYLTKFTIKQCRIDMYTIYELNKILFVSNITDICLDHSPLKEGNYDILLSDSSSLQSLSLSRCDINDYVCERIASRLRYLEPAEPNLLVLNLSSNYITDVGLKHLAEALRGNRHLRYLNVSDNHISDDGAKHIFEVLTEFPMNTDEIENKNKCHNDYLKSMEELYREYLLKLIDKQKARKKSSLKGKLITRRLKNKDEFDDKIKLNARSLALETIGPFEHPFCPTMVTVKEGRSCCIGNFTLCYLNLRYNNLTDLSIQRLANVVRHQKMNRNEDLYGLVSVLLEGNYVPKEAYEYKMIYKDETRDMSKLSIKNQEKL